MKIKYLLLIGFLLIQTVFSQQSETSRILTYNLLNYPNGYTTRDSSFKKVIDEIEPDIVVVQEITSQAGVNIFASNVLGPSFVAGTFINGPDTDNAIYYKDSLFTFISNVAIPTSLRNISQFTLYNKFTLDTLIIYSVHLKANQGDSTQRISEVNILRNKTDALPAGTNYIVVGDFNIYRSSETAFLRLLSQSNSGYFLDPINTPGNWHNNATFASIHTQSTCNLSSCPNGGSNGGLDDRFDMILISQAVQDTGGIAFIDGSYTSFGNDGQHFNKSINDPPFTIITQEMANALFYSSDHLPVFADFEFGSVSGVEDLDPIITAFNLYQNYPNPFNPTTKIRFQVPYSEYIKLVLYDLLGNKIKTLFQGEVSAGVHEFYLNSGNLASGIYFYQLTSKDYTATKALSVIK